MIEATNSEAATDALLERAMALRARCLTRKRELAGRWFGGEDAILFDESEQLIGEMAARIRELEKRTQGIEAMAAQRDGYVMAFGRFQDEICEVNEALSRIVCLADEVSRCDTCCNLQRNCECECEPETKGESNGDSDN